MDAAAEPQPGRDDRQPGQDGPSGVAGKKAEGGEGRQPDRAVDQEIRREGRAGNILVQHAQAEIDDVERAARAEQRADRPAEETARRREQPRAFQRRQRKKLIHRIDDDEGAERLPQRRRLERVQQREPECDAGERERDERKLFAPCDLVAVADTLARRPEIVEQHDRRHDDLNGIGHGQQRDRDQPRSEAGDPAHQIGDEQDRRRQDPLELKSHADDFRRLIPMPFRRPGGPRDESDGALGRSRPRTASAHER